MFNFKKYYIDSDPKFSQEEIESIKRILFTWGEPYDSILTEYTIYKKLEEKLIKLCPYV